MAYCLHCDRKARQRQGVGPTGRKDWMIMVDTCAKYGRHYPVKPREINLAQKSWIDRWNKRMNIETKEKGICRDCGAECWKICYVSQGAQNRLVCVECFEKRCVKAQEAFTVNLSGKIYKHEPRE